MTSSEGNSVQLKFGVSEHEVSVVTAVASLINISDIIKEAGVAGGNERIDVSIRAPKPGSVIFDIFISTLPLLNSTIPSLGQSINYSKVLIDILEISKKMKGDKPKTVSVEARDGNTITEVTNPKGDTFIFNGNVNFSANLLGTNPVIQKAVKNIGESVKKDPQVKALSLTSEEKSLRIEKEDFEYLEKIGDDSEDMQEVVDERAMLTIIRPSFYQKLKSDFYYKGNRITCSILDEKFYKEIDSGKKLAKGDVLESKLVIKQKLDHTLNTFINHSYVLAKVIKHHPRSEQQKIGL